MATPQDNLRKVYDNGLKYYSLPDYETFKADMLDEGKRRQFYGNMQRYYSMPDFETFTTDIGAVKVEEAATSQGAAASSGVQTGAATGAAVSGKTALTREGTVAQNGDGTAGQGQGGASGAGSGQAQAQSESGSVAQSGVSGGDGATDGGSAGWQPSAVQRAALERQIGAMDAKWDELRTGTDARMAGIMKGGRADAGLGEREINSQTGMPETVYYTREGDRVGTRMEQGTANTAYNEWWENNTDEGRRSKEQRLQREFERRLGAIWSDIDPKDGQNAAEQTWSAAEAKYKEQRDANADREWKMYNQLGGGREMRTVGSSMQRHADMVDRLTTFDLDTMMQEAWDNLGDDGQKGLIDKCHQMLKYRNPGADELELYRMAENMARQLSNLRLYDLAVDKNMPKSKLEYFMRKVGDMNMVMSVEKGLARAHAGKTGDIEAYDEAMGTWDKDHKLLGAFGTAVGFAADPTVWISGGVGLAAAKRALWGAGRLMAGRGATAAATEAAVRQIGTTLGGRVLAGVVGGAANFGTLEAMKEAESQFVYGGEVTGRDEKGLYVTDGYSAGAVAKQGLHGMVMGGAIGWLGPVSGNVADKLVRATSSTAGKAAIRTGVFVGSTVAEGTIFSVPQWYELSRQHERGENLETSVFDVWTDNMAMMAGFKLVHGLKSAPRTIAEFGRTADGRKGMESRIREYLDGTRYDGIIADKDLALTKDEKAELEEYGYDLNEMVRDAGDPTDAALVEARQEALPSKLTEMVTDPRLSEAVRAKMYYYATGRRLPMSTVMNGELLDDGNGGFIVQSHGANGVITSRTFKNRKAADLELERINRQAELNRVDIGEKYQQTEDFEKRLQEACRKVADENGWNAVDVYRLCSEARRGNRKETSKEYDEAQQGILNKVLEAIGEYNEAEVTDAMRQRINEGNGVDIDKALAKEAKHRTEAEQAAIEQYIKELIPEKGNDVEDVDAVDLGADGPSTVAQREEEQAGAGLSIENQSEYQWALGRAVMKNGDRLVEVLNGRVVMTEDGSMVDRGQSDATIVIRDVQTGRVEMCSPGDILWYVELDHDAEGPGTVAQREVNDEDGGRDVSGESADHSGLTQDGETVNGSKLSQSGVDVEGSEPAQDGDVVSSAGKYGSGIITIRNSDGSITQGWLTGYIDEDGRHEYVLEGNKLCYASDGELDNIIESYVPDVAEGLEGDSVGKPGADAPGTVAQSEEGPKAVAPGVGSETADHSRQSQSGDRETQSGDRETQSGAGVAQDGGLSQEGEYTGKMRVPDGMTADRAISVAQRDGSTREYTVAKDQSGKQYVVDESGIMWGHDGNGGNMKPYRPGENVAEWTDEQIAGLSQLGADAPETVDRGLGADAASTVAQSEQESEDARQFATGNTQLSGENDGGLGESVQDIHGAASAGQSAEELTPLGRVPKDAKGEPMFEATDHETAWDALVEYSEGDAGTAKEIADAMVEEKKKALDKAQKLKIKGKTPAEMLASKRANASELGKAQQEYEQWRRIAGVEQSRKDAELAEREARLRELKASSVDAIDRHDAEVAEREKEESAIINDMSEPLDIYEAVAQAMQGYKITPESYRKETGYGNSEMRDNVGLIASGANGGKDMYSVALSMIENDATGFLSGGSVTDQDVVGIMIDVLSEGNPRSYIKKHREELLDKRREAIEAANDAYCMEAYGMSYDEYEAYERMRAEEFVEKYQDFDESEYDGMRADDYAKEEEIKNNILAKEYGKGKDATREGEGAEGSGAVLHTGGSVDGTGEEAGLRGEPVGEAGDVVQMHGEDGAAQEASAGEASDRQGEGEQPAEVKHQTSTKNGTGSEQDNDGGSQRPDGGSVVGNSTGELAGDRNRSNIRVLESGLETSYREHSGESKRDRREAESERLVKTAKDNGLFIPKPETKSLGDKVDKKSGESEVFIDGNYGIVYKVKDPYAKSPMKTGVEPEDALYEHEVHNALFPETAYTLEGVSEDIGDVRLVLSQKFVPSVGHPTREQIVEDLARRGLKPIDKYTFGNEYVEVSDVEGDNVLVGEDGKLYFIDPIIRFKKPIKGILEYFEAENERRHTCPVCGKKGIHDFKEDGGVCPQCNSDLTVFKLINELSKTEEGEAELKEIAESLGIQDKVEKASAEVNVSPTAGQAEAGNYKKGHVRVGDLDITIENPKGSVRKGVDANGKEWSTEMKHTYGYIRGTKGKDGDHIDVYLADDMDAWDGRKVYVIDQTNADGTFDEHKVMMGFADEREAWEAYHESYSAEWWEARKDALPKITGCPVEEFREWLEVKTKKSKPFAEYSWVEDMVGGLDADASGTVAQSGRVPEGSEAQGAGEGAEGSGAVLHTGGSVDGTGEEAGLRGEPVGEAGDVVQMHGEDGAAQEASAGEAGKALKGTDNQGNVVDSDGRLVVENVNTVDEITDDDFNAPYRSVQLPELPQKVSAVIGADGRSVIIKKNIFERNKEKHADVTASDSRTILKAALYTPDLYGQTQPSRQPYKYVLVNIPTDGGLYRHVLLEVEPTKENIEIVHWYYLDEKGLDKLKKQAAREDGQLLILPSEKSEEVGALSDPTSGKPSESKGSEFSGDKQGDEGKSSVQGRVDAASAEQDGIGLDADAAGTVAQSGRVPEGSEAQGAGGRGGEGEPDYGRAEYVTDEQIAAINAKQRAMAETSAEAKRQQVEGMSKRLNTPIRIVENAEDITDADAEKQGKMRRAKGWYDPKTGEVVVNLSRNCNVGDVAETVLHEVVAHKGLRELVGEDGYSDMLRDVYEHCTADVRKKIADKARANGWDFEKATDEYLGELSEKGFEDFTEGERSIWQRLKSKVLEAINKLLKGLRLPKWVKLGDNELRYMLWRSKERLEGLGADAPSTVAQREGIGDDVRAGQEERGTVAGNGGDYVSKAMGIAKRAELGLSDELMYRDAGETDDIWKDGSLGLEERITNASIRLSNNQRGNLRLRNDAMRAVCENLQSLVHDMRNRSGRATSFKVADAQVERGVTQAARAQREYDRVTMKRVGDLARVLMQTGYLRDMTSGEMQRMVKLVADAASTVAHGDIGVTVDKMMDIMIDNQVRSGKEALSELMSIRGSRVDARGVEVQGLLDADGARMMQAVRRGMKLSEAEIQNKIAEAVNRMGDSDETIAGEAALEYAGMQIALDYVQNITGSKNEEEDLRDSLRDAKAEKDAGHMTADAYNQLVESTEDAIRKNKIERAEAYNALVGRLSDSMRESIENAKAWREAEKRRIQEIQHNANSDMEGMPSEMHRGKDTWRDGVSNLLASTALAPLATFEQMIRGIAGRKAADGEGYLYNRFVRGLNDAREKEIKGYRGKQKKLDEKVREVFNGLGADAASTVAQRGGVAYGGKVRSWGDVIRLERRLPKMRVTYFDKSANDYRDAELMQGNLLYIYMVDKMSDGRMKLRKMGITESDVDRIADFLDPRIKALGDWLQEEFLVETRNEYNETHKRMFGTSMAAIENYFPLKILGDARGIKEDIDRQDTKDGATSTITGAIKKRKVDTLALDILGADAFNVVLDHLAEMEHWNAYAELGRDMNALLSYGKFRNRVKNMRTIYGAGDQLWKRFKDVSRIAFGTYHQEVNDFDEGMLKIARGVTAAKVAFRLNTALKQTLSLPAVIPDLSVSALIEGIKNPRNPWTWCMENLPVLEERWRSRISGDPRLMKSEQGWNDWRNNVVEIAGRWGMTPNAFIDAVICSVVAKTIYDTKLRQYIKDGYAEEEATKRAKQDASIGYNLSQQSSEGAYLAPIQAKKNWLSVMWTVFRNSPMSYTRQVYDSLRNLGRNLTPGKYAEEIEYMTKQTLRDWKIDPTGATEGERAKAKKAAKRRYSRTLRRDALRLLTYGFVLPGLWSLGGYWLYMLLGNDEEEKSQMKDDIYARLATAPFEGLTGGEVLSNVSAGMINGTWNENTLTKDMPLTQNLIQIAKKLIKEGRTADALNDMINLCVQSGFGFSPATIENAVLGIIDACGGDVELSNEATIVAARILNCPESQVKKLYFDEIGMSGEEASNLSPAEIAERYARMQVKLGRPLMPWLWDDDESIDKRMNGRYGTLTTAKERFERQGDGEVKEAYVGYMERYKAIDARVKAAKSLMESDYVAAAAEMASVQSDADYGLYQQFGALDKQLTKLSGMWIKAGSGSEAAVIARAVEDYRAGMVKVLGAEDTETREREMEELQGVMQRFVTEYGPYSRVIESQEIK